MRRLLTALLSCGVFAAGFSAVAEPVSAEAAPTAPAGPTLGRQWVLPPAPEGLVFEDEQLLGDRVWAVLTPGSSSPEGTLWSTPSDGSGSWEAYVSPRSSAPLPVTEILSAGGEALIVGGTGRGGLLLIHPGGERVVQGGAVERAFIAPGGKVVVRSPDHLTRVYESLTGEVLATSAAPLSTASDTTLWEIESDRRVIRGRDLLDPDAPEQVIDTDESCLRGEAEVRGRWLVVGCQDVAIAVDLSRRLPPAFLDAAEAPDVGEGFVVQWTRGGPRQLVDLSTLDRLDLGGLILHGVDAGASSRILVEGSNSGRVVREVSGLRDAPPYSTTVPTMAIDPLPRTLDYSAARRNGGTLPTGVRVTWSGDPDIVRYRMWIDDRIVPLVPLATSTILHPTTDEWPCVSMQAVRRDGRHTRVVERCSTWDRFGPSAVRRAATLQGYRAGEWRMPVQVRNRFVDQTGITGYEQRLRRGDRFGSMSAWSARRAVPGAWQSTSAGAGTRVCLDTRGRDTFGNAGESAAGCLTLPYDDSLLRRDGSVSGIRDVSALGGRVTLVHRGTTLTTPATFTGRYINLRLRHGPGRGRLLVHIDGKLRGDIDTRAARTRWRWTKLDSYGDVSGRVTMRAVGGPVVLDLVQGSRTWDLVAALR